MSPETNFMVCEYFNRNGRRIKRIGIVDVEHLRFEALTSDAVTSLEEGAFALKALIHSVIVERIPIEAAHEITSLSVNFRQAVAISAVVPVLDATFGSNAGNWAREIFPHLNLGPAGVS